MLSIVVVAFDMEREAPRTIRSLLPPYQQTIAADDIEIIVADNGSTRPMRVEALGADTPLRVIRIEDGGWSPCRAVNRAAALATGDHIAVLIDGARMATPGLLSTALKAARTSEGAFVATLGFHLGPKPQQVSTTEGYDRKAEDQLLAAIDWPADGHRLFEISCLGESYRQGVFAAPPETTFFAMRRDRFQALGGFDERFTSLGGGFANYDFFERALEPEDAELILLVGEATFHQLHYGATTQADGIRRRPVAEDARTLLDLYLTEYEQVRGRPYVRGQHAPTLYGTVTHPAVPRLFFPADGLRTPVRTP